MKRNRFLACVLALCLTLALLPTTALAADTVPVTWLPEGVSPLTYLEETGQILAFDSNNLYLFDKNGTTVSTTPYAGYEIRLYSYDAACGLIAVEKDGKHGFIDQTGKVVIPVIYDYCDTFHEGLAAVGTGNYPNRKCGFINTSGQLVIPMDYDGGGMFSSGLASASKNGKDGYIDATGKTVIPFVYDFADGFYDGVAIVGSGTSWDNMKYGLIDTAGRLILPIEYDVLRNNGDVLVAYKDGKLGYIDRSGKVVGPFRDDPVFLTYADGVSHAHGLMSDGCIALFDSNGNTYYTDMTGKAIGGTYDYGGMFNDGLAYVEQDGKYGYIDKNGNLVFYLDVPDGYEVDVSGMYCHPDFSNGLARVAYYRSENEEDGMCGIVDKQGNVVLPFQYDYVGLLSNDSSSFFVIKDERYGVFFPSGTAPTTPPDQPSNLPTVENIPAAGTAVARTQTMKLDGKDVEFQCYAVKNADGNESNYVKVRDLAQALNGTKAQFNVGWDGKISITSGTAYEAVGGEGTTPYSGDQPYKSVSGTPVSFNGSSVNLTSFSITYQGGGYTYYKLRDLGQLLGFNVKWDGGVVIETDKPYTGK